MTSATGNRWLAISYAYASIAALGLGYFLMRVPIQLTDCFSNMLALHQSWAELMRQTFTDRAYLRPGLWVELKLVYDLARGDYFLWFRLTQVLQVLAVMLLFVRLVQPRTALAASVVPLGLAVLIGHHLFAWTVREAFPINTFLTILVFCALAANVAFGRHRPWSDALAVAIFVAAAATVESGVLVWVICMGGYLIGLRGVSRRGIVVLTACLVAYFALRSSLGVGLPGLAAREAGYGFERYTGEQLTAMFADNPYPFYAYNVAASVLGALFAEPRDGVWRLVRSANEGRVELHTVVNVVASTLGTLLIASYIWARRREWRTLAFDRCDRMVLMFGMVLAANATISFAYTKDVIMSPTSFFCAAAVFGTALHLVERLTLQRVRFSFFAWAMVAVLSCTWAVRAIGIHAALSDTARTVREQWANAEEWPAGRVDPLDGHAVALKQQLQDDAVVRHPAKPALRDTWIVAFDVD